MALPLRDELKQYLQNSQQQLTELLLALCQIPAPSHHEEQRAAFCKQWLERQGAKGVYIDEALNVVYPHRCREEEPVTVFMAHTDTVFPDTEPFVPRQKDGRLYCPGVGDDTANLAVLMLLAKYVIQNDCPVKNGLLFVCNSCEEGLGNLKGSRQIMADYAGRVHELISLDGYYLGLCDMPVGSMRYRVTLRTEGGHSYGDFGNRNAIEKLSSMIQTLYTVRVPQAGKTTYNVGEISGGTSVNTIAQSASMLYEFRSDSREGLSFMKRFFTSVVESYRNMDLEVEVELLGERPCMGDVDPVAQKVLADLCADAIEQHAGKQPMRMPGSTDCNIPLSLGVPACCFGVCLGGGAHTRGEYIELDSLPVGAAIAATVLQNWLA